MKELPSIIQLILYSKLHVSLFLTANHTEISKTFNIANHYTYSVQPAGSFWVC
jgi:hypothetical protein